MAKNKTLKEATAMLRGLFSKVAALSFSQFEDEEGNVYQYSVLEVGAEVFKAGSEGSEPAADGEYKVDEYTSIKVEGGVISEVHSTKDEEIVEESDMDFKAKVAKRLKATGKFEDAELDAILEEIVEAKEEMVEVAEEVADTADEAELLTEIVEGVAALVEEVVEVKEEIEKAKEELDEAEAEIEALKEGFSKFSKLPATKAKFAKEIESRFNPNSDLNKKAIQGIFSKINKK